MNVRKLFRNKKGVSPIASTIMIGITIASMLVAMTYSQTSIQTYHEQMGEKLCIEQVFVDGSGIRIYVRNIGHGVLTLLSARINGRVYSFSEGKVVLSENLVGQFITVENYQTSSDGIYRIELTSSHQNSFEIEVKYP